MSKSITGVLSGLALAAIGFFIEPFLPLGDWRWLVIASLFVVPNLVLSREAILSFLWPRFDMRIEDAIAHILVHNPSTHTNRRLAEMNAFRGLYDLALSRTLALAGSLDEGLPPVRIPRKKLRNLAPIDQVIPASREAPEGHVYALGPATPPTEPREYKTGEIESYTNILVRSRDLYRHWPKLTQRTRRTGIAHPQ